jgi:hypothetical protein
LAREKCGCDGAGERAPPACGVRRLAEHRVNRSSLSYQPGRGANAGQSSPGRRGRRAGRVWSPATLARIFHTPRVGAPASSRLSAAKEPGCGRFVPRVTAERLKPAASRRSGLSAFRAGCEISGLGPPLPATLRTHGQRRLLKRGCQQPAIGCRPPRSIQPPRSRRAGGTAAPGRRAAASRRRAPGRFAPTATSPRRAG